MATITRSPASSPSSSPDRSNGETKELTPRSKVKAALAAIDSDTDESNTGWKFIRGNRRTSLAVVSGNARNRQPESPKFAKARGLESEDDDNNHEGEREEEDEVLEEEKEIFVPRGRLAGRLKSRMTERKRNTSPEERSGSEDAYIRIKKRLLNGAEKAKEEPVTEGTLRSGSTTATTSTAVSPTAPGSEHPITGSESRLKESSIASDQSPAPFTTTRSDNMSPMVSTRDSSKEPDLEKPLGSNRFLELVAKKRAEREAKDAEEARKLAEKSLKERELEKTLSQDATASDGYSGDDLAEKHLTQSARPTRKASKKAFGRNESGNTAHEQKYAAGTSS